MKAHQIYTKMLTKCRQLINLDVQECPNVPIAQAQNETPAMRGLFIKTLLIHLMRVQTKKRNFPQPPISQYLMALHLRRVDS